jgi:hypothetical protein
MQRTTCHRCAWIGPVVFTTLLMLPVFQSFAVAQQAPPVTGTLMLGGKTYTLTHAVAYPKKLGEDSQTGVLLCDRAIDAAKIAQTLKENDGNDIDVAPRTPYLRLTFDAKGKLKSYNCYAGGTTISQPAGAATAELKIDQGQVTGLAKLEPEGKDAFRRSFDLKFSVPLLGSTANSAGATASGQAQPLRKPGVEGKFIGNGKAAKLAFVSAYSREPFADKASLTIVMTEKDHSRDAKPDFKAGFGNYGDALIISCHEQDGNVFGCVVSHSAHAKRGFSSVGAIDISEFQITGGQVQGRLQTAGEEEFFSDKWLVDLTFAAPYKSTATPAAKTASSPAVASAKPEVPKMVPAGNQPRGDSPPVAADAKLKATDLAMVKDVPNVEFKKLVQHITYTSDRDYKTLAGEIGKQLAAQGWQVDGRDLVGVSAILKRKRGAATLTIFVKPAGTGSQVNVMTSGLDWE